MERTHKNIVSKVLLILVWGVGSLSTPPGLSPSTHNTWYMVFLLSWPLVLNTTLPTYRTRSGTNYSPAFPLSGLSCPISADDCHPYSVLRHYPRSQRLLVLIKPLLLIGPDLPPSQDVRPVLAACLLPWASCKTASVQVSKLSVAGVCSCTRAPFSVLLQNSVFTTASALQFDSEQWAACRNMGKVIYLQIKTAKNTQVNLSRNQETDHLKHE